MSSDPKQSDLEQYCDDVAHRAATAARALGSVTGEVKNRWLLQSAKALRAAIGDLLAANAGDLAAASDFNLDAAQIDRLRLDTGRIEALALGLEGVARLPDPVGQGIESQVRPSGLEISKIRVPLGVVFFIYESRPNVTADAAAICVKSGNAVILRGGKEAAQSSRAIVEVLRSVAAKNGLPADGVQLVGTADRAAVGHFLRMDKLIDVAIPRGGSQLIERVTREARMPVIKHYQGNCHIYVDTSADLEMAFRVTLNSKCQRMGVCNACESLVVHRAIAESFLPEMARRLTEQGVELRGDATTCRLVPAAVPADESDYGAEFLGPVISVKTVESLADAIAHINHYGSRHTDAIITQDLVAARRFVAEVDSSAVLVNASTRFNDGSEFGLGAEIGISTDKFHARGPCGLKELTSYKYVVYGSGHVRT